MGREKTGEPGKMNRGKIRKQNKKCYLGKWGGGILLVKMLAF